MTPTTSSKDDLNVTNWTTEAAQTAASEACSRIAPLWPLRHFVAVNPFLGLTEKSFAESCQHIAQVAPGGMQIAPSFYQEKLAAGEISASDLETALVRAKEASDLMPAGLLEELDAESLRAALLANNAPNDDAPSHLSTFSEVIDSIEGTTWNDTLVKSVTDFCAAWLDEGQSAWRMPWKDGSLSFYSAWREYAQIDCQLDTSGLEGFRKAVADLPESPAEAIAQSLDTLKIDPTLAPLWLHRILLSVRGWAGYLQYQAREKTMGGGKDDGSLLELLAVRVVGEAILHNHSDLKDSEAFWPPVVHDSGKESETTLARAVALAYLAQLAHEHAWEQQMKTTLAAPTDTKAGESRADVQAVFCIDVRSEIFRRALESVSTGIQTSGFAGFFGLAIEYQPLGSKKGRAQCPVLLVPQIEIRECHHDAHDDAAARKKIGLIGSLTYGWNAFKTSAISCFSFVETAGLLFGASLVRDGFAGAKKETTPELGVGPSIADIAANDRVALAHGILKNLGLTNGFGRLVLLCGHGSETANNPYGSGLDCGACGGHAGDSNARVGALLLNDTDVRSKLKAEHQIVVPEDTWFLAGLHNTTTDDVAIYDLNLAPATHNDDVSNLKKNLAEAGRRGRQERSTLLGLSSDTNELDANVRGRANDWAQVRPEWGLAGNAAFVAAPRARTRNANLGGRVFLHDYDHEADTDKSILELIMVAPMVVANWINLQYYGSTVNNDVFGSGNKVLHNVVGTLGVCLGNNGDLQTGLPFQSVHDGNRFIHEPLRLHVFLEAPQASIDKVIATHAGVKELVNHQWLHVFALDAEGTASRRKPGGGWE